MTGVMRSISSFWTGVIVLFRFGCLIPRPVPSRNEPRQATPVGDGGEVEPYLFTALPTEPDLIAPVAPE